MIEIVLATHGNLGQGLYDTVKMVTGTAEDVRLVDLMRDDWRNQLEREIQDCKGYPLYITDLPLDRPAQEYLKGLKREMTVLTGVNLGMFLEIILSRSYVNDWEVMEKAVCTAKESIMNMKERLMEADL